MQKKINLAMIGFGNVARSLMSYCLHSPGKTHNRLRFAGFADTSGAIYLPEEMDIAALLHLKTAGLSLRQIFGASATISIDQFLDSARSRNVNVLLESLPTRLDTAQPALDLVLKALSNGIPVVTVDKGPLIHSYAAVTEAAQAAGVGLGFNGTTGVCPPSGLLAAEVVEIEGVLNGTTNYLLSALADGGDDFDKLIATAQDLGIAEPDPSFDLDGWDSAGKILIMASRWMGFRGGIRSIPRIGIGPQTLPEARKAAAGGKVLRLIARASQDGGNVALSVRPEAIGPQSPFFNVRGTDKAAVFRTRSSGDLMVQSRSGRDEIARVILADIFKSCPPAEKL